MSTPEPKHWCYYIGDDCDERVTLYQSEDEARGEAEAEIDASDWCEPGDVVGYTVAPMLSALDVLRTRIGAERLGRSIVEMIEEWVSDEMLPDDTPITLPAAQIEKLGQVVVDFYSDNAKNGWWTVDTKRKTRHTYVAGSNNDAQEQQP